MKKGTNSLNRVEGSLLEVLADTVNQISHDPCFRDSDLLTTRDAEDMVRTLIGNVLISLFEEYKEELINKALYNQL